MNLREICAYLKIKGEPDETTLDLIKQEYSSAERAPFFHRTAFFNVEKSPAGISLVGTDIILPGSLAKRHFENCSGIYVILGSLGLESERKLKETFALSPTRGVVLDACYSELLERRLDSLEKSLSESERLTSRISCGYGDLPLAIQEPLLDILDARGVGVHMNESYMLIPNKSVVALVGVKEAR